MAVKMKKNGGKKWRESQVSNLCFLWSRRRLRSGRSGWRPEPQIRTTEGAGTRDTILSL
jgi:hypothetical protein